MSLVKTVLVITTVATDEQYFYYITFEWVDLDWYICYQEVTLTITQNLMKPKF